MPGGTCGTRPALGHVSESTGVNKAFTREPDPSAECCPRCGSKGEAVGPTTLAAFLSEEQRKRIAASANFCPSPQCPVAYFDGFERFVLASDLSRPVYPKDASAPMCGCFGLTRADVEQDVREGVVARTKATIGRANSPEARCSERAANGRPCVAYVQKYYLECRNRQSSGPR
jgi:hypothetical protein